MFDRDQLHDPEFRNLVRAARAVIAERVGRGIATPAERLAVAALDEMPDEDDPDAVRAWAPFTNRTSRDSPAGSVLLQSRALTSLRRIPAMEEQPRDRRVELAAFQGDLVEPRRRGRSDAAGWQVARPSQPPRKGASPGHGRGRQRTVQFAGRARLDGEAGPRKAHPQPPPSTRSSDLPCSRSSARLAGERATCAPSGYAAKQYGVLLSGAPELVRPASMRSGAVYRV